MIATSIRHEVFDNYLPCCSIMNISNTTSISAISTMTAPLNLSYLTPTILLLPFNYDFPKNLTATHANFTRQLIVVSKRGVSHAQLIIDNVAPLFSVSEGAQDVDPAAVHKESFKVINGSYAKGVQAKIQTYCRVKITALKLQRNKDFQFIVESDSQGGQQNDPVVGVNSKTLLSFVGAWPSIDVFDCKRQIVISRARAAPKNSTS